MPARLPQTTALEEARETLEAAREDVAQVLAKVISEINLTAVATVLAAWRQAAESFANEARSIYEKASDYFDGRTEKWQDSDEGLALAAWRDALEELAGFDGEDPEDVHIRIDLSGETLVAELEGSPSDALPEAPDIPELEE